LVFVRHFEIKDDVPGGEKISDGFQWVFLLRVIDPPAFDPLAVRWCGMARTGRGLSSESLAAEKDSMPRKR
jgi:hypothetical protein